MHSSQASALILLQFQLFVSMLDKWTCLCWSYCEIFWQMRTFCIYWYNDTWPDLTPNKQTFFYRYLSLVGHFPTKHNLMQCILGIAVCLHFLMMSEQVPENADLHISGCVPAISKWLSNCFARTCTLRTNMPYYKHDTNTTTISNFEEHDETIQQPKLFSKKK